MDPKQLEEVITSLETCVSEFQSMSCILLSRTELEVKRGEHLFNLFQAECNLQYLKTKFDSSKVDIDSLKKQINEASNRLIINQRILHTVQKSGGNDTEALEKVTKDILADEDIIKSSSHTIRALKDYKKKLLDNETNIKAAEKELSEQSEICSNFNFIVKLVEEAEKRQDDIISKLEHILKMLEDNKSKRPRLH